MDYISTRGMSPAVDSAQAVLNGLAPDGGLYVPKLGKGVYEIISSREDMTVTKVLCRRDLELSDAVVTHDFANILEDETIDTVVEAIGGLHPAYEYVRSAILAGKNVATANKALIATCFDELIPLAREKGVFLRCTASVGGGAVNPAGGGAV